MTRTWRILVVDDEPGIRESLALGLGREGYDVSCAENADRARRLCQSFHPDVALVDVRMPGEDGMALLSHLHAEGVSVVMISGNATLREAVLAVKEGAFDFLEKPLSIDKVIVTISRAIEYDRIKGHIAILSERSGGADPIGISSAWREVMETAAKVAPTDAGVLIQGESGTGKERVAEWIHSHSPRLARPFVPVNVAAIPESLVESELFGHEKGAFTGAAAMKKGKFELADGGTLFLDEIAEMPIALQPKLLRAIESGEIQRLGSEQIRRADIRILAATNRDLQAAARAGQFREDLFFRLNVIPIRLPPLRDRGPDIDILANHFLGHYARKYRRENLDWSADALRTLHQAPWPGNIRELKNLCERLAIMADGLITDEMLEPLLSIPSGQTSAGDLRRKLDAHEMDILRDTLSACGGNPADAALRLGISRSQLYRKLDKFGIKLRQT